MKGGSPSALSKLAGVTEVVLILLLLDQLLFLLLRSTGG